MKLQVFANYLLYKLGVYAYDKKLNSTENCIFHSNTLQARKDHILSSLKGNGLKRIIVSTTALYMGVNFPDICYVVIWGAVHLLASIPLLPHPLPTPFVSLLSPQFLHSQNLCSLVTQSTSLAWDRLLRRLSTISCVLQLISSVIELYCSKHFDSKDLRCSVSVHP